MAIYNEEPTPITRLLVPEDQRLAVVEKLFGLHFPLHLEPVIYSQAKKMTGGVYSGGYWQFYTLDNGGFYMAPDGDSVYQVSCMNYWQGELTADALGLTSALYAFSHCSFSPKKEVGQLFARHYHLLREFMFTHPEVAAIRGAID